MNEQLPPKPAASTAKARKHLCGKFDNGQRPEGKDYAAIFDSTLNIEDDGIGPVEGKKGHLLLDDDATSLTISPDEIKAAGELKIASTQGNLSLTAADEHCVVINELQVGDINEVNRITFIGDQTIKLVNNAIALTALQVGDSESVQVNAIVDEIVEPNVDDNLPTTNAVINYQKTQLELINSEQNKIKDLIKQYIIDTQFAGADYLVTTEEQQSIYEQFSDKIEIFNKILPALNTIGSTGGHIYVISNKGFWQENIKITQSDITLTFDKDTLLIPELGENGDFTAKAIITVTAANPITGIVISANINGKGKARGIYSNNATISFKGAINNCWAIGGHGGKYNDGDYSPGRTGGMSSTQKEGGEGGVYWKTQGVAVKGEGDYGGMGGRNNNSTAQGGLGKGGGGNGILGDGLDQLSNNYGSGGGGGGYNCGGGGGGGAGGGTDVVEYGNETYMYSGGGGGGGSAGGGIVAENSSEVTIYGDIINCHAIGGNASDLSIGETDLPKGSYGGAGAGGGGGIYSEGDSAVTVYGNIRDCRARGGNVEDIALSEIPVPDECKAVSQGGGVLVDGSGSSCYVYGMIINCNVNLDDAAATAGPNYFILNSGKVLVNGSELEPEAAPALENV